MQVGLCSVLGSDFPPPADTINGHLLYIDEDSFDISQRAWDFMRVHATGHRSFQLSHPGSSAER